MNEVIPIFSFLQNCPPLNNTLFKVSMFGIWIFAFLFCTSAIALLYYISIFFLFVRLNGFLSFFSGKTILLGQILPFWPYHSRLIIIVLWRANLGFKSYRSFGMGGRILMTRCNRTEYDKTGLDINMKNEMKIFVRYIGAISTKNLPLGSEIWECVKIRDVCGFTSYWYIA